MLSDDITGTVSSLWSKSKAVLSGVVRGALLGVAVVAVGALLLGTGAGILAALGATSFTAAGTAIGAGFMSGVGTLTAGGTGLLLAGAQVGAATLGIASIIPGVSKWLGSIKGSMSGLTRRRPDPQPLPDFTPDMQASRGAGQSMYNPDFKPGYGTQSMNRGNEASQTMGRV